VLLLDGIFLHRDELVGAWDFSVFLDVPVDIAVARMVERDGPTPIPTIPATLGPELAPASDRRVDVSPVRNRGVKILLE
jgi:hypothetical protein